ncbi:segregation/condensation protein A [Leptothermofonsia sichuanensis E412]|uniref:segregation/condensation protein A n=1 Tax=Leptothermofonsia sichuanensis TaxID=2917832 RepID=UPI001CA7307F|nr:ScpA family protein [Leptothermofonsia sichuanensis]QZZ20313.1 segregation/condensation protein A [Leptothermofonsia sichuanensis E412]
MTLSLAQDAIAFLIDLAERGEIDPWDVKVIDVIDRFLSELTPQNVAGKPYEATLSQSGQAFLYASMLVLLKAESLSQTEVEEETSEMQEDGAFQELGELGESALPPFLERRLRRRAVAQPPQRRRVTLKELIDQIRSIAAALEEKAPRSRIRRPRPQSRSQAVRAIAQLAHQENLSEMAIALEHFFQENWATITQKQDWLDFELLLEFWTQIKSLNSAPESTTQPSPNHDRVGVFWALLLLTSQSKVELEQTEFYQDLKIRLLHDGSVPNEPGAHQPGFHEPGAAPPIPKSHALPD